MMLEAIHYQNKVMGTKPNSCLLVWREAVDCFYDRRGPLFVLPFLAIHIILLVACTISLILLTNGLSTLCDNLRRNSHEK